MIVHPCAACGRPVQSPESLAGQLNTCPVCGAMVPVPPPGTQPPLPPAQVAPSFAPYVPPPHVPEYKLREAHETWATKQTPALIVAGVLFLGGLAGFLWALSKPTGMSGDTRDMVMILCGLLAYATLIAVVGGIPGMIARRRRARNYMAINVLGYVGMLTLILPWVAAIIWACTDSKEEP